MVEEAASAGERSESAGAPVIVLDQRAALAGSEGVERDALRESAFELIELHTLFAKTEENIVGEVLRQSDGFVEWEHYPENDVYDPETGSQYYYHAHPPEERGTGEHGHFHLFMRERGMPAGAAPFPGQELPEGENAVLTHLVAISMNPHGLPIGLFTTNRWVTGDIWYPAQDVVKMIDGFAVDVIRPNLAVNRWLTAMVRLFRPQIVSLIEARDRVLRDRLSRAPAATVFEDRRTEVMSYMAISVEEQVRLLCGESASAGSA